MTAPKKRIVYSTDPTGRSRRRTRLGLITGSVLECGHMTDTNAGDRRRGHTWCFGCYYGRPADPMGLVILAELTEAAGAPCS